jgi:hypothetical protein
VQVKITREGQVEKTLVDKKPQGVWKKVKQYMEEHGTDQEKEAAKSWSVIKLYYKFGLSNLEVGAGGDASSFSLPRSRAARLPALSPSRVPFSLSSLSLSLLSLSLSISRARALSLFLPPALSLPPSLSSCSLSSPAISLPRAWRALSRIE